MKSYLRTHERVISWSALAFSVAVAFYIVRFAPIANRIVGSWPMSDLDQTAVTTFKPNGEWELVSTTKRGPEERFADGSSSGVPVVFKGYYSTWFNTFRIFDVKRYLRANGKDFLWEPSSDCVATNSCSSDSEIMQLDKEASDPEKFLIIVSADWWTGKMTVRSSSSGKVETWTRN
ncbi:MAG: hypothetical protein EOP04_20600 [Proteobacteria bacterium]|nr:MAG: hypothetical protein EOP04_20600 [Pseudomonadota bacterium]